MNGEVYIAIYLISISLSLLRQTSQVNELGVACRKCRRGVNRTENFSRKGRDRLGPFWN